MEAKDGEGEREQEMSQSYKPPPSDILPSPPKSSATFPKQNHQLAIQERPGFLSLVHTLTLLPVRLPTSETTCSVVWVPSEVFWLHQKWVWALNDEN